ncbi:hypothetical protein ACNOYE_07610 [Nannocystaceae bacterium ST9]
MAHQFRFGLLLLPLLLLGCPDSEARFDEFLDNTQDNRPPASESDSADMDMGEDESAGTDTAPDGLDDMSGTYLLALETALGPDTPLEFITTIDMMVAEDGMSATATFVFQPLSLDMGSQVAPREFVGEPLTFDNVTFDAEGNYTIDMGEVMVTGAANPVTGSDIVATLVIDGHIVHINALCGGITGMLTSPLQADLAGSTFGMLRLAEGDDGSDPATLPTMFPYQCDQVPPPPEEPDTGTDTGTGTDSTT